VAFVEKAAPLCSSKVVVRLKKVLKSCRKKYIQKHSKLKYKNIINNRGCLLMTRICNQCQTEMIDDYKVTVEADISGLKISQKGKGLFKNVSAKPKASVCPNCGNVALYIDDFKKFQQ
jgi:hypothetical protein